MSEDRDISQLSEEEKFKIYDQIGPEKKLVLVQDLQWPFIRVTYPNPQASELALKRAHASKEQTICFVTDILSVEKWFYLKKGYKHFVIFPPAESSCYKFGGFSIAAATEEDAIKEATAYYKKRKRFRKKISRENGWQIKEDDRYFQYFFSDGV